MYIYKLGTECDGAQTRASDVYVPTLVALLGLCFDPSECFRDLCVWSRVVGNKSGKLWYVSQIVTNIFLPLHDQSIQWLNAQEKHEASDWIESHLCCAWRPGFCMVDGTLIPLFAKPGHYGKQFFDWKSNYSLSLMVCCPVFCIYTDADMW